jgi:large subunit ribosomal protein L6
MSKVGKKTILVPAGVDVSIDATTVRVKWPKGELTEKLVSGVSVVLADGHVTVSVENEDQWNLWGLYRSLVANMITWVTEWYTTKLHIIGVGYNAQVQGNKIVLSLWYSHKINFDLPTSVTAATEQDPKGNTILTLQSHDKQMIGQTAAKIREFRKPEPYKGKWVRYFGEEIKLKPGKASAK